MGAAEVMPETPLQAVPILSRESSFSSSPRRYHFQHIFPFSLSFYSFVFLHIHKKAIQNAGMLLAKRVALRVILKMYSPFSSICSVFLQNEAKSRHPQKAKHYLLLKFTNYEQSEHFVDIL